MLYLNKWQIAPEHRNEAMERFAASATDERYALPEGVTQVCRYHNIATLSGVQIVEADDLAKVMQWAMVWNDILTITTEPVIEDEAAGAIIGEKLASLG